MSLPPPPGYGQQPHQQPDVPQHGYGAPQVPAGYGQQPAGYGQPVGYGQPATQDASGVAPAYLDLTVQGSVMTRSFVPPNVWVNGRPLHAEYGRRLVPVPAGPVRVNAQASWMRTYGQAELAFTAAPGQTVPVFYAAPMHQFTTGAMGHVQQKHKGAAVVWGILGGVLLLTFGGLVAAILLG